MTSSPPQTWVFGRSFVGGMSSYAIAASGSMGSQKVLSRSDTSTVCVKAPSRELVSDGPLYSPASS